MSRKIAPEMSCPPRQQSTITLPAEAAIFHMIPSHTLPLHSFSSYFYRRFWR